MRNEGTYGDYATTIGEAVNPNSIRSGGTHLPINQNQSSWIEDDRYQ